MGRSSVRQQDIICWSICTCVGGIAGDIGPKTVQEQVDFPIAGIEGQGKHERQGFRIIDPQICVYGGDPAVCAHVHFIIIQLNVALYCAIALL